MQEQLSGWTAGLLRKPIYGCAEGSQSKSVLIHQVLPALPLGLTYIPGRKFLEYPALMWNFKRVYQSGVGYPKMNLVGAKLVLNNTI